MRDDWIVAVQKAASVVRGDIISYGFPPFLELILHGLSAIRLGKG